MTGDGRRPSRRDEWRAVRARRVLTALLVAVAVVVGLTALRPAPEPTVTVLVAARDLPAGHRLENSDLRAADWPAAHRPPGQIGRTSLSGERVLGPIRAGEPITRSRLLTSSGLRLPSASHRVVSVPLADAGLARLLRVGDRVDVLGADGTLAARSAPVTAVLPPSSTDRWRSAAVPSLLVAVTGEAAGRIARAAASGAAGPGGSAALMVAWAGR